MLAFSRQQKLAPEPVDLNLVIRGMEPLLRSTIGGSIGISIQPAACLQTALADPTQLELAVLNLAINARDAMPTGGCITVETANVTVGEPVWPEEPNAGDYVAVRVSDTGSGIPDDVRGRIFEPFFTTKGIGKGSGLGLPQVLGVVKQLGGGVAVRSTQGQGTSIAILLPLAEDTTDLDADAAIQVPPADDPVTPLGRILLVDDDADVRSITAAMLNDAGFDVQEASSGAAALDALERADGRTAMVVADIGMPGINGVELAAIVRRTWPALPVLLMTGYAGADLLRAGADHEVLRKPFNAAELEAKVQRAMDRRRSLQA